MSSLFTAKIKKKKATQKTAKIRQWGIFKGFPWLAFFPLTAQQEKYDLTTAILSCIMTAKILNFY